MTASRQPLDDHSGDADRNDPGARRRRSGVNVSYAVGVLVAIAIATGVVGRIVSLQDPAGRAVAFRQESRQGFIGVRNLREIFPIGETAHAALANPLELVLMSSVSEIPRTEILAAESERFDRDAPVVLTPGADAAAGRRGVDDDFDGVTDNDSELGAFGSDDHCVTPVDPEFEKHMAMPGSRVIGRGAFVPFETDGNSGGPGDVSEDRTPGDASGRAARGLITWKTRVVITGKTRGRTWVWPVQLE